MQPNHTEREIATQVDGWRDGHEAVARASNALKTLWRAGQYETVIFTGCGSTHYLAMSAAALFQQTTGVMTRAIPASELLLHPELIYGRGKPLLVTISRSGATTETVRAAEAFKARTQGEVIVVSCYGDKPLNEYATVSLVAAAGQEMSVAQTRSFSSMVVMAEGLALAIDGEAIPDPFGDASDAQVATMREFAANYADPERYQRLFYLGSGALYGLACEGMLKMKEMSLTSAEAFHPLEFRHGPKSMVDEQTLIVGLLDERNYATEIGVIDEMRKLGATTVTLSPDTRADIVLEGYTLRPSLVHYLPFVQWLAYLRAMNKGLNPDAPRHLEQVVFL